MADTLQPSGPIPIDRLHQPSPFPNHQQQKKRLLRGDPELTRPNGSSPKRQNTNKQAQQFDERSHERGWTSKSSTNRNGTMTKSGQLMEVLSGGSATPKQSRLGEPRTQIKKYPIPLSMFRDYQAQQKPEVTFDRIDPEDDDSDIVIDGGTNVCPLFCP